MRYLTGVAFGDGEDKVAGHSGQFLIGGDELIVFADSRYTIQIGREAPEARVEPVYGDLLERWPALLASIGARRVGVEAASGFGWERWLGADGLFIGVSGFGASAPAGDLFSHFGITAEAVAGAVIRRLGLVVCRRQTAVVRAAG